MYEYGGHRSVWDGERLMATVSAGEKENVAEYLVFFLFLFFSPFAVRAA